MNRLIQMACASIIVMMASASANADNTVTVTYFHTDRLGSAEVATDASGNVVFRETYAPFGQRTKNQSGIAGHNSGYTGHQFDRRFGLVHMGMRDYDPLAGRFTGPDPVVVSNTDASNYSRYTYANNNPLKYIDPTGGDAEEDLRGWIETNAPFDPEASEVYYKGMRNFLQSTEGWQKDEFLYALKLYSDNANDLAAKAMPFGFETPTDSEWTNEVFTEGHALSIVGSTIFHQTSQLHDLGIRYGWWGSYQYQGMLAAYGIAITPLALYKGPILDSNVKAWAEASSRR